MTKAPVQPGMLSHSTPMFARVAACERHNGEARDSFIKEGKNSSNSFRNRAMFAATLVPSAGEGKGLTGQAHVGPAPQ